MDNKFPHPFSEVARRYRALRRRLPGEVGDIAVEHFKENFRRQGILNGTVIPWKARKKTKGKRRRAILILTGRLRRAIRNSSNYDTAIVSNDTPYAAVHNEGLQAGRGSGFLMPARPFMVTTPDLEKEIEEHFFNELDKIWK